MKPGYQHSPSSAATASKAEAWANQLGIDWAAVDVDRPDDLVDHLRDVDVVLVALPFQGERSRPEGIVDAAIQTGTDYLDIIPDPEKSPVLRDREAAVQKAGLRLLTEGGIVPGMPSALVRRDLDRLNRWLAPGPSGLMLQCITRGRIDGQQCRYRTRLFHPDVYESTAIATVAALDQLLAGSIPSGIHYMGGAVDPEQILDAIEQLGTRVDEVSSFPDDVDQ